MHYSTVYFRDKSGNNNAKLGIKCEHSVPDIIIKDDTIILNNTGDKVSIREDNSTQDWQEFFEVSFDKAKGKVVVKFKNTTKMLIIRPISRSYKCDFEIMEYNP